MPTSSQRTRPARTPAPPRRTGRTGRPRRRRAPAVRRSCTPRSRRPSTPPPRPGPGWRAPGHLADRAQHRHRPAGIDQLGAEPLDRRRQRVGDPAALTGRAVVGGDGDLADQPLGRQLAEQPAGGGGAQDQLDPRPGPAAARPAAAAGPSRNRRRPAPPAPARAASGTAPRAGRPGPAWRPAGCDTSHRVPRPCTPPRTGWCRRTPRRVSPRTSRRIGAAASSVRAADRDRDELPGLERSGHPGATR